MLYPTLGINDKELFEAQLQKHAMSEANSTNIFIIKRFNVTSYIFIPLQSLFYLSPTDLHHQYLNITLFDREIIARRRC
jgi:hypothetical protein